MTVRDQLQGITDLREITRIKAQAHYDALQAIPIASRTRFSFDGLQVQILTIDLLRNLGGRVVGLTVQARARDSNGVLLPFSDGIHQVVNPPVLVPDGTVSVDGTPNYVEDLGIALKMWLTESLRVEARRLGWTP